MAASVYCTVLAYTVALLSPSERVCTRKGLLVLSATVQLTQGNVAIFVTNPSQYIAVLIRGECLGRMEPLEDAQVLGAPDDTHCLRSSAFSAVSTSSGTVRKTNRRMRRSLGTVLQCALICTTCLTG
ncbi:hypothetical protein HPB50_007656 [Hyalomma asiaticum]|uniref:Uncharacterized protein n=1 Tax=Hyalomma asiaticum TaxID=266040 RepID=A0ACB7TGJ8_HYAAI|nr:hypothetical protein HPB50_007656 [Hyalomma asiaticum]